MNLLKVSILLILLAAGAGAGFVYSGIYDVAADRPHWPLTSELVETLRERSIAARLRGIEVPPDLGSAERVRRGAGNYDAMCAGCHLKPGMEDSEIRRGLYPHPPDLTAGNGSAARQFWVIRHGIKMTAMPSWSKAGVDDATIWDMVALLQRLPTLSPAEYAALVATSAGHSHSGAHPGDHGDDGVPVHGHGTREEKHEGHTHDHSH